GSTVEQEPWLTTTRDDDGGTLAQSEIASKRTEPSWPARSSEDEAVAMVQPSAVGAQAAPASKDWGPSSEPPPGAQMATGLIIDVLPASTVQQEPWLTTTRDDDGGTLAESEIAPYRTVLRPPARSSEDEAVAMVQPSAVGAQAAPASKDWGPSSEPPPGAQMATGLIIDVPPAPTIQQEPWLTTTRD